MILNQQNTFVLHTDHTTYSFAVTKSGHLEHLYYGERMQMTDGEALKEKRVFIPGNCNAYHKEQPDLTLEDLRLEFSSYGKGDIREPFVEIQYEDGSGSTDFLFVDAKIEKGKAELETMPCAYGTEEEAEHLLITLEDQNCKGLYLDLFYQVFAQKDIICRSARIRNESEETIKVQRLMSLQLDLLEGDYQWHTFTGSWANEMNHQVQDLIAGTYKNESVVGVTSNRNQSFVMLTDPHTTEDLGDCYGFHLIYSGNHCECAQVSSYGKVRILTGISPQNFSYQVGQGETFEAPEAVLTYSKEGFNGMSRQMHRFIRKHIVRGVYRDKERPILLNSWEASYFKINEAKLLKLAKKAKAVGIELFVMDDGWFGERDDDTSSLGDWVANPKKLPNGVEGICKKINNLGLDFGIWVEPEMVNVNSKLYNAHPEWVMDIPGKAHSEGRNQRFLDLGQEEVQDYIIHTMSQLLSSCPIAYVKWDMNRTMTDLYSKVLPPARQGEAAHRYVLGLYRCMKTLTEAFPQVLFEGCASGGNRFDLGILSYFPQIWASDNTDAMSRMEIQNGYSYGYPTSTYTCHVAGSPNHQTLRKSELSTRYEVACFGILGYECNLCDLKQEELDEIKEQIRIYKEYRALFQFGDFYRTPLSKAKQKRGCKEWTIVDETKEHAVGLFYQGQSQANHQTDVFLARGLRREQLYQFMNRKKDLSIKEFGDLVNAVAPIHVGQGSFTQNLLSRFISIGGEVESQLVTGDELMKAGVLLKPAFSGTGWNEEVRVFRDGDSRLYYLTAKPNKIE